MAKGKTMLVDTLQTVAMLTLGGALLAQVGWNMTAQRLIKRLEDRVKGLGG